MPYPRLLLNFEKFPGVSDDFLQLNVKKSFVVVYQANTRGSMKVDTFSESS